jgi:hypothetical protein
MTGMTEMLDGVARISVFLWATLFAAGLFAWLSLLAAVKAEQKVSGNQESSRQNADGTMSSWRTVTEFAPRSTLGR